MNLLGIIFSKKGKEERTEIIGQPFITKNLDPVIADEMQKHQDAMEKLSKGVEPPFWLRAGQLLSMLVCVLLVFIYALNEEKKWSFILLIATLVILVGFAIATAVAKRKEKTKRAAMEEEARKMSPKINATFKKAKRDMGIPPMAIEVDALTQKYERGENGSLKNRSLLVAEYASLTQFIYKSNDNLVISGIDMAMTVPLSAIKSIKKVDKKATFLGWNKEKPYNATEFKPYEIKRNRYDVYSVKCYYEMTVECETGSGVIKFPPYELAAFEKTTQLKAE